MKWMMWWIQVGCPQIKSHHRKADIQREFWNLQFMTAANLVIVYVIIYSGVNVVTSGVFYCAMPVSESGDRLTGRSFISFSWKVDLEKTECPRFEEIYKKTMITIYKISWPVCSQILNEVLYRPALSSGTELIVF